MAKKTIILILIAVFLLMLNYSSALVHPVYVKPKISGSLVPNTYQNYTLNFSTDKTCTNVLISKKQDNVAIGSEGVGVINVTIPDYLSSIPLYVCEYRNGVLRASLNVSTLIFDTVYAQNIVISNNITVRGNVSAKYICVGSGCYDDAEWYNHTLATFDIWGSNWYNHTLATFNLWNSVWNQSIWAYNQSDGCYNSSYARHDEYANLSGASFTGDVNLTNQQLCNTTACFYLNELNASGGGAETDPLFTAENSTFARYDEYANLSGADFTGDVSIATNLTVNTINKTGVMFPNYHGISMEKLMAYWNFNGNTIDYSKNGNKCTPVNAVSRNNGKFGSSYFFDGTGDYLNCGKDSSVELGTTNMSISVWINPSSIESAGLWDRFVAKGDNSQYELSVSENDGGSGAVGIIARTYTSSLQTHTSYYVPPLNEWTHVVWTYDNATSRIYINGLLQSTASMTGAIAVSTGENLIIGDWDDLGREFNGYIDEVMIFNRTLNPLEVLSLYENNYELNPYGSCVQYDNAGSAAVVTLQKTVPAGTIRIEYRGSDGNLSWINLVRDSANNNDFYLRRYTAGGVYAEEAVIISGSTGNWNFGGNAITTTGSISGDFGGTTGSFWGYDGNPDLGGSPIEIQVVDGIITDIGVPE